MSETMSGSIAKRWRLLHGENNWNNLLDPPDVDLRQVIIHYGEMSQAIGDAFILESTSKFTGGSRYAKEDFFSKVGLSTGNPFTYEVTKFIYAKRRDQPAGNITVAWDKRSSWIGYVAVATDEGKVHLGRRDIAIVWRGTMLGEEILVDADCILVTASSILGGSGNVDPKVHKGWFTLYTASDSQSGYNQSSARDQVLDEVKRLVAWYKNEELSLTLTGHSMGASLATINAVDIVANGYNKPNNKPCLVSAILVASPRVGDANFLQYFSSFKDLHLLRVRNEKDLIPTTPPNLIGYREVGIELKIDTSKSPCLKSEADKHNLESYLHGVAGTQGSKGGFKLEVQRDITLVNKMIDGLKDEYHVPVKWWTEKNKLLFVTNKLMVQQSDGSWKYEEDVELQTYTL